MVGRHDEVAAFAYERRKEVERALMIAEGGCVNAFRYIEPVKIELRGSIEHVPDLAPVDEVAAVEDGHAGIERKRRRDEVIVCTEIGRASCRERVSVQGG